MLITNRLQRSVQILMTT